MTGLSLKSPPFFKLMGKLLEVKFYNKFKTLKLFPALFLNKKHNKLKIIFWKDSGGSFHDGLTILQKTKKYFTWGFTEATV